MKFDRNLLLFLVLCAIWGTTWIGIKAGVEAVPPLFFAGTRFTTAGFVMLAACVLGGRMPSVARRDWPRLAGTSLLMITFCYAPLFWGMLYVDSGTAAVLEMSLTPIALMGFAVLLGEEAFDRRRAGAIALGICGLAVLFGPTAYRGWLIRSGTDAAGMMRVLGAAAVAFAAITYAWGSVAARPLLRTYPSLLVAGVTTFAGGGVLLALSLAFEPGAAAALSGRWGLAAWSGWLFLVLFGSLLGYTMYMRLLRDIGATRAGTYAFVSPVVAVLLGMAFFGEQLRMLDVLGMAIMLLAAALAMFESGARAETA
ncbi:DMT family transporter [Labrys monachus]|uniref:Drug/metabolite transporter (DMT)-like permease n=1 Tax=Labrys monachus TaxID=217067 RepID=A0ABU0FC00_9HYPH|nr:EamA family transporter [Labrys monachus]MDQ0391664.1 drug/metabolite transporter (DMT)-like permease [Labrys monachus]